MALQGLENPSLKLILFGGKGGVGKTTCACSTALHLSTRCKTLLCSMDPAHSLADSLGQKIGDQMQEVAGTRGLTALEVNAEKAWVRFRTEHENQIRKIIDTSTNLDAEDIDSVVGLPVPGIDEVIGFKVMVDLIEAASFDKYVVDTAPTGHALRLLASPRLLDDWIQVMAKLRWKYRYMVQTFAGRYKPDEGDDLLITMKRAVRRIEELLRDPRRSEFIVVTIPEEMAVAETERLIHRLSLHGIRVRQLVVNHVLEADGCTFCQERRKEQYRYIDQMKKTFAGLRMTIMPSRPREVRGLSALADFHEHLLN